MVQLIDEGVELVFHVYDFTFTVFELLLFSFQVERLLVDRPVQLFNFIQ